MALGLRPPPHPVLLPRDMLIDTIYRYLIDSVFDKTIDTPLLNRYDYRYSPLSTFVALLFINHARPYQL